MTKATRKKKKSILAIPAAPAAIPPKPRIAAIIAMIKNVIVHLSIKLLFRVQWYKTQSNAIPVEIECVDFDSATGIYGVYFIAQLLSVH
jgi:hypothetical protein